MIPPRLRKLPRLVAVDPRLEEVMPAVYRELMRPPWEVAPFGPGGGGYGPANDRPRVLVDGGDIATTVFVRECREARPMASLYLVARPAARTHRRLPLLARFGVDDVFFSTSIEAERLFETLARNAAVRGLRASIGNLRMTDEVGAKPMGPPGQWMLSMLERDPCPPWHVRELYRRCGFSERAAERGIANAHLVQMRRILREVIVQRARQLRGVGLSWRDVAELLRAPSVGALHMRVGRAAG